MEDEPGSAPSLRASNRLRVIQALQLLGSHQPSRPCAPYRPVALDRLDHRRRPPGRGHGRRPRRRRAPRRRRPPARADRARPVGRVRDRHRLRQAPPGRRARGPVAPAARRGVARDDGRLRRRGRHRGGRAAGGDRCSRRPARTRAGCSAWAWGCPGRSTARASSAPRRSCPGWAGTQAAERMARAALDGGLARQRREPRRARRVHLGRRARRVRPRLPQARHGHRRRNRDRRPAVRGSAEARPGEIGHTSLDETGDICRCGSRGCLETYASGSAIAGLLSRSLGEPLSLDDVIARAVDGDPGCRRALADAGRHIGASVADLCNLINPERIVVGGSMAVAGDVLLDPLREAVGLRAIPSAAEDVEDRPRRARGPRRVARRGRARAP